MTMDDMDDDDVAGDDFGHATLLGIRCITETYKTYVPDIQVKVQRRPA